MKVYLDDVRTPRYGDMGDDWCDWILVRTVDNFTRLIRTGLVTEVSVDYGLGESDSRHTGEDALQELLYGLYALISVHFLKEEDLQLPVFDADPKVAERVLARMGESAGHTHTH